MSNFTHRFEAASAEPVGHTCILTSRAIEDAGLLEILQTPGAPMGYWGLFDVLLDGTSPDFVFREPLGRPNGRKCGSVDASRASSARPSRPGGDSPPDTGLTHTCRKDLEIEVERVGEEELDRRGVGIARRHMRAILRPLGHVELATALSELVHPSFRKGEAAAR